MVTNVLFYVSSAINPILYNLVSANYRQIFFSTLRYLILPCRHKKQKRVLTRHSISICSNQTFSTNVIKETIYWTLSRFSHSIPRFHPAKERPLRRSMLSYWVIIPRFVFFIFVLLNQHTELLSIAELTPEALTVFMGGNVAQNMHRKLCTTYRKNVNTKKRNVNPLFHHISMLYS